MTPVVVRRGTGPVHLAKAIDETHFTAVCGAKFRGVGAVVPVRLWDSRRTRHCPECAQASAAARNIRVLAKIAGW